MKILRILMIAVLVAMFGCSEDNEFEVKYVVNSDTIKTANVIYIGENGETFLEEVGLPFSSKQIMQEGKNVRIWAQGINLNEGTLRVFIFRGTVELSKEAVRGIAPVVETEVKL